MKLEISWCLKVGHLQFVITEEYGYKVETSLHSVTQTGLEITVLQTLVLNSCSPVTSAS